MADTTKEKAYKAQFKAGKKGADVAEAAASKYVWSGLKSTGLSAKSQQEMAKKLVPIVKSRIANDLARTATRGAVQVKREEVNAKKKAFNKIMGGR